MGSNPRWKKQERQVARALGTERLPNDGGCHPDAIAGPFAVEVKTRKGLPAWLTAAVDQAKAAADGRVPIVVLVQVRQGVTPRRLVVVDFADWQDLHGPTERGEGRAPRPPGPEAP
jgi:hypothetical protein